MRNELFCDISVSSDQIEENAAEILRDSSIHSSYAVQYAPIMPTYYLS